MRNGQHQKNPHRLGAVAALAFLCLAGGLPPGPSAWEAHGQTVEPWSDVRNKDLRGYTLDLATIRTLWFNTTTVWDPDDGALAGQVLEAGKNPGLGVRGLHSSAVTGSWVTVAIIDQNLCLDHPQFDGKILKYRDFGTGMPSTEGSMHGPAVAGLLVGSDIGTAPGAKLYYAAVPSWKADAQYYADALDWLIAENQALPSGQKIRAVSVSAAPSGPGTPFTRNTAAWDQAYQRAAAAGILVLDCTTDRGQVEACYYDTADPENAAKCTPGFPRSGGDSGCPAGHVCAPNSFRTQAEEYEHPQWSYQYMGQGGLSWSIPYATGVLAMGWQVNPKLSKDQIWQLLVDSAVTVNGCRIINPPEFIRRVRASVSLTDTWISHVSAAGGWETSVSVYNPGISPATIQVTKYSANGGFLGLLPAYAVPSKTWTTVPSSDLNYEGAAHLTSSRRLLVKLNYQYGASTSVCEFYLAGNQGRNWVVPNSGYPWLSYTGIALTNPNPGSVTITLEAWKNGTQVAQRELAIEPNARFAVLSDQIWPGVGYSAFDTAVIRSASDIPAPISISGNTAQDRHLFFAAQLQPDATWPTDVWVSHVTGVGGWKTSVSVYNPGAAAASFQIAKYNASGDFLGVLSPGSVPSKAWTTVSSSNLNYEGVAHVISSRGLLVKLNYQFGSSPSVCEFYLDSLFQSDWVIPNPGRSWFSYTGAALVNSFGSSADCVLEAWKNGRKIAQREVLVNPHARLALLSDGIWPGIRYADFDTMTIRADKGFPAPISLSGNTAQDRHLFFAGRPEGGDGPHDGHIWSVDPIVGNLRFVPGGTFTQGSPGPPYYEPCAAEGPRFQHTLTRSFAVMELEVTGRMWTGLAAVQPSLLVDSSSYFTAMAAPVQRPTWSVALLFANLLSLQRGLTRCYYTDGTKSIPIDATNYTAGSYYCDFSAAGFRLPTEGEWEYFARAGTAGPFWVDEPNYSSSNCDKAPAPGMYPRLEKAEWFANNSGGAVHNAGTGWSNPLNLRDVLGNVKEWCWDWYGLNYPSTAQTDYTGPAGGAYRICRGGNWSDSTGWAKYCRSASRSHATPDTHGYDTTGFRLVLANIQD